VLVLLVEVALGVPPTSRMLPTLRGAFLHLAADAMVSVGVVLAGLGIIYTGPLWLDPVASLIISVVIVVGAWALLRDSIRMYRWMPCLRAST